MTTLTVGADKDFTTIAAAVGASGEGDTILVDAGVYDNDFTTIQHSVTMRSVGGLAIMTATVAPPNGKAIITADASLTIDGFGFTGVAVGDQNGCGIRYEAGDLVVRNSVFWDNQEGILANPDPAGTILIEGSEFSGNGAGDGRSHNIYVGNIASLTVRDSYFHDSVVGHEIKSRAVRTVIENNRIFDNGGNGSYAIDLPNGGIASVTGNVIQKGANTENQNTIHFGGEDGEHADNALVVSGNTIINDRANGFLLLDAIPGASVSLTGNQLWGWEDDRLGNEGVSVSGNTVLAGRPTLDQATMTRDVPKIVKPPVFSGLPLAEIPAYADYGREGAVTASGHVLTVGPDNQFTSIAAALKAAQDGDTIRIAAGTYVNDFGLVDKKVILEGVGGMVRIAQDRNLRDVPAGQLTVAADATLRNIEIMNSDRWGREPGLRITGGHVTLVNTYIHDNVLGLLADDNADTTLSVYDSEIGPNGNNDKGTNNIQVGRIGSFTMSNTYVHGGFSGHEVSARAYNTVIEDSRIIDGTGGASFLLNLGQGGNAIIRNNVLGKSADAANGVLVHIGGEEAMYENSNVVVTGNRLVSEIHGGSHPYSYFVMNDIAHGVVPLSVTGNTFVGGDPGSQYVVSAPNVGNTIGGSADLDMSPGYDAGLAAAWRPDRVGPNTLKLSLNGLAAQIDSQFVVSVDGVDVGGGVITARDGIDPAQSFSYSGWWGSSIHTVAIRATNALWKANPSGYGIRIASVALDYSVAQPDALLDPWNTSWSWSFAGQTKLPDFDAAFYLSTNPDVAAAGVNPLQHYLDYGWHEGRNPNAWFDTNYYLAHNPDVMAAGGNPLEHFEQIGWAEGRDPSAQFSVSQYLAHHPDVAAANVDPLQDYMQALRSGDTSKVAFAVGPQAAPAARAVPLAQADTLPDRLPDPLVDAGFYLAAHPDAAASGLDATTHYNTQGWKLGYDPDAWFSTGDYLRINTDVAAVGMNPLRHFEDYGWKEGRDPSQYFSLNAYRSAHPGTTGDPLAAFITSGEAASSPLAYAAPEASLFNAQFYLSHNPDVAAAHVDPLLHYEEHGWHEGRDPSAGFSTEKYLAAYSDVRAANIDPFGHYAVYGQAEGRSAFAS